MTTPRLGAPELVSGQAVPETTVNEQAFLFDAFCCAHFIDRDLTAPPGSPSQGDCYLVAASATGAWAAQDGNIAVYIGTSWTFVEAKEGFVFWVDDEDIMIVYDGVTPWQTIGLSAGSFIPSSYLDTDDTLAADSDTKIASQQAVKAYVDGAVASSGGGDMLSTNNLSDVASVSSARTNLDVYSKSQVDSAIAAGGGGTGGTANDLASGGAALSPPTAGNFTLTVGSAMTATLSSLASGRGMVIQQSATTALNMATAQSTAFTVPAAGTDFSVRALFATPPVQTNDGFGISIKDSTGKVRMWGWRNGDIGGATWTNESTVSTGSSVLTSAAIRGAGPLWFRVDRVGTNFKSYMSADGETWVLIDTTTTTAFLGSTISSVGVCWWSQNNVPKALTCLSFTAS